MKFAVAFSKASDVELSYCTMKGVSTFVIFKEQSQIRYGRNEDRQSVSKRNQNDANGSFCQDFNEERQRWTSA